MRALSVAHWRTTQPHASSQIPRGSCRSLTTATKPQLIYVEISGQASSSPDAPPYPCGPLDDVGHWRVFLFIMITVAIIEDNRLVREGMTELLNELSDVTVVLAAPSVESETLMQSMPRVVLIDVGLEDRNSLRLAETVQKEMPDSRVIVMDLLPAHEEIVEFVNAGVSGFILKDATLEEFVGTIRSVADGMQVLPPPMTGTLFSQIARAALLKRGAETAFEAVRLTQREREVIALIAEGLSNKAIAQRLNIATDTVKSHVRKVMDKLALRSRLQIAAYALNQDA